GPFAATIALSVPGVSLGGSYSIKLDTAAGYLRIEGTGVSLNLLGQSLTGNFVVEQATNAAGDKIVKVGITSGGLSLANGLATVSGANGLFVITAAGVAGRIAATVAINAGSAVSLGGSFSLAVNTTGAEVVQSLVVA